jgi:sulfite exporter TauE/SafE
MTELLSAFLIGLVSSSHCMGMCGGLAVAAGLNASRPILLLIYNLGRICTYIILGVICHFFTDWLPLSVFPYLQLLSSLLLVLSALYILNFSNVLSHLEKVGAPLWKTLQPLIRKTLPVRSVPTAFGLGLLWGFIPCGLVYTALVFSLSQQTILYAAGIMLFFGLGTLPALMGISLFAQHIRPWLNNPKTKVTIAVCLFIFAYLIAFQAISSLEL